MDQPIYDVKVLEDGCRFDFLSVGYTATHKAILYKETEIPFLYSLTLTEVQHNGRLVTTINNSNRDVKATMATVFKTIETFTAANPRAVIGFTGNTDAKTRLYRIEISRDLDKFLKKFLIWESEAIMASESRLNPISPTNFSSSPVDF